MTGEAVAFYGLAFLLVGASLLAVSVRNIFHAAMYLIVALFAVAGLFLLLNAEFLAAAQVLIYVGAVSVLLIFAVMLTRKENRDQGPQTRPAWWIAALLGLLILGGLVSLIQSAPQAGRLPAEMPQGLDTVRSLGEALVSPQGFVLPFEAASVLLLAALVGAVYIAGVGKKD